MENTNNYIKLSDINLGIVTPMANESSTAKELIKAVLAQCYGFKSVRYFTIFDNVCKDGTFQILRDWPDKPKELNVIWAPENRCVVDAYVHGYKEALQAGCDWILEIDAGFSHNPSEIRQFFDKMSQGYDCVFGSRFCKGGQFTDAPLSRYIISRGGTILTNILLGTKLKDMTSGFEMFTSQTMKKVLNIGIKSRGHFFQTEIKTFCRKLKCVEVPIHYSQPSENVNTKIIFDAFGKLFGLFKQRLAGKL